MSLNGGNERHLGGGGLGCTSNSLIMRSEEGHSHGADDSKMKSQEGGLTADEQLNELSGQDESSSLYPLENVDTQNDFQKANHIVEQARREADTQAIDELEKYHRQNLNEGIIITEEDSGILHADAEDDLRMIQE